MNFLDFVIKFTRKTSIFIPAFYLVQHTTNEGRFVYCCDNNIMYMHMTKKPHSLANSDYNPDEVFLKFSKETIKSGIMCTCDNSGKKKH